MSASLSVPFTSDMDYSDLYVNVVLRDVNNEESFPTRHFPVGSTWSFKIGRGSQNEDKLNPRAHNSWFGSRVMSREHAEVHIDQITREIKITDLSSMHGTYLYGERLIPGKYTKLYMNDVVTFGTDVVRGEHTYRPLQLAFEFEWSDGANQPGFAIDRFQGSLTSGFGEDIRSFDNEIEVLGGPSNLPPDPQLQTKPRTFSVPDSDDGSESSEKDDNPLSSPLTFDDDDDDDEVTEIRSVKFDQVANTSVGASSTFEIISQKKSSQVIIIDDEQSNVPKEGDAVDMAKIFRDAQEPVIQNAGNTDPDHYDEDANDDDFDSEAADFHMYPSDEDEEEASIGEDCSDASGDDAEALDAGGPKTIQVAEFLQPIMNNFEAASFSPNNTSFNREDDTIFPVVDSPHDVVPGRSQTFGLQNENDTTLVSEPALQASCKIPVGSGRVSIHNIINEADAPSEPRLKRKADVLIDHESGPLEHKHVVVPELSPNVQPNDYHDIKPENETQEPPKKIAKTEGNSRNENSRSKTFLRYTATAVAGAAVGAVTAVFGLAALPADYFI